MTAAVVRSPSARSEPPGAIASILAAVTFLSGCASHNLTPVAIDRIPAVNVLSDDAFQPVGYGTFSVFPVSRVDPQSGAPAESVERPALFMLRNAMESRGYRFVNLNESPDLLMTVKVDTNFVKKAPSALEPPAIPASGMISRPQSVASLLGDRTAISGWGAWKPPSEFDSPLPGYPPRPGSPENKTRKGRTVVEVSVSAIDTKTFREVWTAAGRGVSRSPDPLLGSQLVLRTMLRRFPRCPMPEFITGGGLPGLNAEIMTNDGTHYFPTVTTVRSGSAALKSGIKKWDMIVAVNATTTADRPYSDFRSRIAGEGGTNLTMTLWRNGKQMHTTVERRSGPRSAASRVPPPEPRTADYLYVPRRTANTGLIISGIGAAVIMTLVFFASSG